MDKKNRHNTLLEIPLNIAEAEGNISKSLPNPQGLHNFNAFLIVDKRLIHRISQVIYPITQVSPLATSPSHLNSISWQTLQELLLKPDDSTVLQIKKGRFSHCIYQKLFLEVLVV